MVTRYIKAYPCLQSLVMCGKTFNMIQIEVTEGYAKFSNSANMDRQRVTNFNALPHVLTFIFSQF